LIETTIKEFGRIDILILNAGAIAYSYFEDLKDLSTMEELMKINYYGAVYPTRYALPYLK